MNVPYKYADGPSGQNFVKPSNNKILIYSLDPENKYNSSPIPYITTYSEEHHGFWNPSTAQNWNQNNINSASTFILELCSQFQDANSQSKPISLNISSFEKREKDSKTIYTPFFKTNDDKNEFLIQQNKYDQNLQQFKNGKIMGLKMSEDYNNTSDVVEKSKMENLTNNWAETQFRINYGPSPQDQFNAWAVKNVQNKTFKVTEIQPIPTIQQAPKEAPPTD